MCMFFIHSKMSNGVKRSGFNEEANIQGPGASDAHQISVQSRPVEAATNNILENIMHAIREIYNQNASQLSFEELYRQAYELVLQKHGQKLYSCVQSELVAHLHGLRPQIEDATDDALLGILVGHWKIHATSVKMISDILMYMDRRFVATEHLQPVKQLGIRLFREEIIYHEVIRSRLSKRLLSQFLLERNGETIDKESLRNALQLLVEIGQDIISNKLSVYQKNFEEEFLKESSEFYRLEASRYIDNSTCSNYLSHAEKRIDEERSRALYYLHGSTETELLQVVNNEFICNYSSALVDMENSGCVSMLLLDKTSDLKRMYALFEQGNLSQQIASCMCECIKNQGEKLLSLCGKDSNPTDFTSELVALREKFDKMVRCAFADDRRFQKSVESAFQWFMNKDQRCSQFLGQYLDELMRRKIKTVSLDAAEVDQHVDKIMNLFRYLEDKDLFENFYKKQLAKRLLLNRSVSEEAEMIVIKKLKAECGYSFTSRLEGMLKDMKRSKELVEKYHKELARSMSPENSDTVHAKQEVISKLHATVLTDGIWPTETTQSCIIPSFLRNECTWFEKFYAKMHSGRRLSWVSSLGTAEIKMHFAGGSVHEFVVSTNQMCILDLFNGTLPDTFKLTFKQICDALDVEPSTLTHHIMSLVVPRWNILLKSPGGRAIDENSTFCINSEYSSKHYRVRVPLISTRDTLGMEESTKLPNQVEDQRRHLTEAAIVRIMKTRKVVDHFDLISEVTKEVSNRFVPSPSYIKKRVESLIERDYLERTGKRTSYRYLA